MSTIKKLIPLTLVFVIMTMILSRVIVINPGERYEYGITEERTVDISDYVVMTEFTTVYTKSELKKFELPKVNKEWKPIVEDHFEPIIINVSAPSSVIKAALLTSYYTPRDPARAKEFDSCLIDNIGVDIFSEVHVFYNPDEGTVVSKAVIEAAVMHKKRLVLVKAVPGNVSGLPDKFNIYYSKAYLYSDFFRYANNVLAGKIVFVSNADIVFDNSSFKLQQALSAPGMNNSVYTLSRHNTPCPDCKHWTCTPTLCFVGSHSSDVFAFVSPLPESIVMRTNHRQDRKGSENIVIAEFAHAGMNISNPCKSVTVLHRHCAKNFTVYENSPSIRDGRYGTARVAYLNIV